MAGSYVHLHYNKVCIKNILVKSLHELSMFHEREYQWRFFFFFLWIKNRVGRPSQTKFFSCEIIIVTKYELHCRINFACKLYISCCKFSTKQNTLYTLNMLLFGSDILKPIYYFFIIMVNVIRKALSKFYMQVKLVN